MKGVGIGVGVGSPQDSVLSTYQGNSVLHTAKVYMTQ